MIPGRGEGMVNGVLLRPTGQNEVKDLLVMRGADSAFVGPVALVDRILHRRTGIEPVMPGPTPYTRQLEGLSLGTDDLLQFQNKNGVCPRFC